MTHNLDIPHPDHFFTAGFVLLNQHGLVVDSGWCLHHNQRASMFLTLRARLQYNLFGHCAIFLPQCDLMSWTTLTSLFLTWLLDMVTWRYLSIPVSFISSFTFCLLLLCSGCFHCLLFHSIYIYKDPLEHSSSFWPSCIYTVLLS